MKPVMKDSEFILFMSFLKHADSYVEFGTGGSTLLASQNVSGSIVSVDSSREWLAKVENAVMGTQPRTTPNLVFADIGPVGDWGRPTDVAFRPSWESYHWAPWRFAEALDADLYLVDGRFRVASFIQVLLNCRNDSLILIHDFADRPSYHVVRNVAREVASAENLSCFVPPRSRDRRKLHAILAEYAFNPD